MTSFEETEHRVIAFVAQELRDGRCALCLTKAMIACAIDAAFEHDIVEHVHALLRRCADSLDQCKSDEIARPH